MTHTVQTQSAELARQRKQFGYQLESAQYEAKAAEERGNQLAQKLQLEVDLRRDSQVKADRCDLAERDARQLREEVKDVYFAVMLCKNTSLTCCVNN